MMHDVHAGLIDVIVVDDMSRYTREQRLIEDLILLADAGTIEVHNVSGTEYDLRTAEGRMSLRNTAAMNAYYADYISKQVKRKKLSLIKEDHSPGGSRAFGV